MRTLGSITLSMQMQMQADAAAGAGVHEAAEGRSPYSWEIVEAVLLPPTGAIRPKAP